MRVDLAARLSVALAFSLQSASAQAADADTNEFSATSAPASAQLVVPARTPLRIEVLADVGSAINKSLDRFPIRLAEPLVMEGREVIPAGTLGEGEVVHAKKAGGSGASGELVLAARWLDVSGRRLRLRSMRVGLSGRDAVATVDAMNVATVLAPAPIGMLGLFITGRNVVYAKGTAAQVLTAEPFAIAAAPQTGAVANVLSSSPDPGEALPGG